MNPRLILFKYKSINSPEIWSENRIFSDGVQGISQGTVFIVNVQVELVNSGRSGVIGVSHLPTDLENYIGNKTHKGFTNPVVYLKCLKHY